MMIVTRLRHGFTVGLQSFSMLRHHTRLLIYTFLLLAVPALIVALTTLVMQNENVASLITTQYSRLILAVLVIVPIMLLTTWITTALMYQIKSLRAHHAMPLSNTFTSAWNHTGFISVITIASTIITMMQTMPAVQHAVLSPLLGIFMAGAFATYILRDYSLLVAVQEELSFGKALVHGFWLLGVSLLEMIGVALVILACIGIPWLLLALLVNVLPSLSYGMALLLAIGTALTRTVLPIALMHLHKEHCNHVR